jgi:hypothetical protein
MRIIVLFLISLALLTYGCQSQTNTVEPELKNENTLQAGEDLPVEVRSLSEIQVSACETADIAGTCDSRLAEVGFVLKEECCEVLNKCC